MTFHASGQGAHLVQHPPGDGEILHDADAVAPQQRRAIGRRLHDRLVVIPAPPMIDQLRALGHRPENPAPPGNSRYRPWTAAPAGAPWSSMSWISSSTMLRVPASAIICAEDSDRQAFPVRQGKDLGPGQPFAFDQVHPGAEGLRAFGRGLRCSLRIQAAQVFLFDRRKASAGLRKARNASPCASKRTRRAS